MPQIMYLSLEKFTLFELCIELVLPQQFKHLRQMLLVLLLILAVDEDVVEEDDDARVEQRVENVLHHCHKDQCYSHT